MAFPEELEEKREEVEIEEMPEEGLLDEELLDEELPEEDISASPSLTDGVSGLIENWNPETPEGQRYLEELEEVMAQAGGEELGAVEEEGMEEGMEEIDDAPGPSMEFDIVAMRNRAAKNAFPEMV